MLKKEHRGLKSSEIADLFKGDSVDSISNKYFRLNWQKSEKDSSQFVIIVSKKVHKSAVVRNKLRRKVYEMVRQGFSMWTESKRVAILIKNSALDCSAKELRKEFQDLIEKAINKKELSKKN